MFLKRVASIAGRRRRGGTGSYDSRTLTVLSLLIPTGDLQIHNKIG